MLAFIIFPFLLIGSALFVLCGVLPSARRYALGAALWWVAYVVLLIGIGMGFVLTALLLKRLGFDLPQPNFLLHAWERWTLGILLGIITIAGATCVVIIHGWILRRITIHLFRVYLGLVSCGVGFFSGFVVGMVVTPKNWGLWPSLVIECATGSVFAALFSWFCVTHAVQFRGTMPEKWSPLLPHEYTLNPNKFD